MTNPTPDAALLPCPWCGETDASIMHSPGNSRFVFCHCCEACGPLSLRNPVKLWNDRAGQSHADAGLLAALEAAESAIAEYYRYWTGGETRGSYDGKPERNGLWEARQKARAAIAAAKGASHD